MAGRKEERQGEDMKAMSTMALAMAGLAMTALAVTAKDDWGTDFDAVKKAASEGKKVILADFTGSDWCPWCMKLDGEVFKTDAFKTFAKENLVLFVADFPNEKQVAKETADQNRKLAEKYGVQGFPTVLLLDANGKELARTGYRRGGAEAYVEHLKGLMEKASK